MKNSVKVLVRSVLLTMCLLLVVEGVSAQQIWPIGQTKKRFAVFGDGGLELVKLADSLDKAAGTGITFKFDVRDRFGIGLSVKKSTGLGSIPASNFEGAALVFPENAATSASLEFRWRAPKLFHLETLSGMAFTSFTYQQRVIEQATEEDDETTDHEIDAFTVDMGFGVSTIIEGEDKDGDDDSENVAQCDISLFGSMLDVSDKTLSSFQEVAGEEFGTYWGMGVKVVGRYSNLFVEVAYRYYDGNDENPASVAGSQVNIRTGVIGIIKSW